MPDLFDQLEVPTSDIFDQLAEAETTETIRGVPRTPEELQAQTFYTRQRARLPQIEQVPAVEQMAGLTTPAVRLPKADAENPNFVAAVSGAMGRPASPDEVSTIAALLNTGTGLAEMGTSVVGAGSAALGGLGGIISKLVSAGWGIYGGSQIKPSLEALRAAQTPQQKKEAALGLGLNVAMPVGAAMHIAPYTRATPAELLARQIRKAPIQLPTGMERPVEPLREVVTAATYTNPETGETTTGPNHPAAAAEQGVKAPEAREARETPEYGFQVEQPTGKTEVVSRDTAEQVARQSGQLKEEPKGEKVHSDEILSPTEPSKTISEQEQTPPPAPPAEVENAKGIEQVATPQDWVKSGAAANWTREQVAKAAAKLEQPPPPFAKGAEAPPTLTPAESTRLKSLTEKLESGKPLTSAEQKRYRALKDKVSPPEGEKPGVEVVPEKTGDRASKIERIKAINAEIKPLADKGGLTRVEADRFRALSQELNTLRYDVAKPLDPSKIGTPKERKSTLPTDVVVTARNDLLKNRNIYDPVVDSAVGVFHGADTPIDDIVNGNNPNVSAQQLYDAFGLTREALRKQFGNTITLYRAVGKQKPKPTTNWATTKEYAKQFGDKIQTKEVPVDNVLAVNVGISGKYHEVIVWDKPPTTPPSTGEGMVGPGARTVGEPPYRAIQQLTDQLEATPPGPAKERIPMRERLADAWGQGKTAWEKALGKMTASKQSLKDTARGVRTPKDMDRRVGELDWSLQQSAAQSLQAGKALEKQMPNKAMREAVAIWVDAGGDENLIRNVLANLPEGTPKNVRRALEVASNLPPESRALAEQTRQFYGIRAQDGMSADVLHSVLDDYFTHTWKTEKNMPDDVRTAFSNGRLDTFFRNALERKIPMFLNGILQGKAPELDPVSVIPNYNYSMDRAIASRKFIKEISEMTEADGRPTLSPVGRQTKVGEPGAPPDEGALLIKPKARWEENGDYHYVDHPALRKWKWAGTDENGRTILYQSDLVVHPDAYERISRMMDRGRLSPSKLTAAALRLSTEVKGFKLGVLSAFHTVHVGSHALFHWTDPIKAGITPIDWEAPNTRFAVEKGHLKLAPNPSELQHFAEGLLSPGLVHKLPLIGAWSKQFSEWNFGTYIPRLKMATFENGLARAKFMRDKMGLFKGLSDEELAARTGDSVNNAFGELNQLFLGKNGRAPEFQRLLRGIFLAPDFGEARLRFAEKFFTKYGWEERIALGTMFGVFYTTARLANLVSTGDPQWDAKRAFSVKIGNHWWSMRSVIGDAWRAVSDFGKFLYPRLNPVYTRPIMDLIVGRDVMSGKKLTTFDKLVTRPIEQIVPIHLGGLTRDDQKVWESFAGSMGLAAIRDTPEMDMKRMAAKWLSDNGHPPTAEYLPTDTPTYAKLRQALAIGNDRNARKIIAALKQTHEDKKIMDAMERYVNHPFTGSNEHEDEFVGAMSEPNLKLYQRAKEQRQKTLEDFYKIWFSIPKAKE